MAANHINQRFNEDFLHVNIENLLRIFRDKWRNVCQYERLSRAGWDDAAKTITLHGNTFEEMFWHIQDMLNFSTNLLRITRNFRLFMGREWPLESSCRLAMTRRRRLNQSPSILTMMMPLLRSQP